jgi:hypothetical protein
VRTVRTLKALANDRRVPRPLRWAAGFALLPIPGPFDELVLVLLVVFFRKPLRDAWREAAR